MYGPLRFLNNNLVTESMITMGSMLPGWPSTTKKVGEGSALLTVTGDFTGTADKLFFWQIDSISSGQEVGQATYRWRTNETAVGAWEATGVTTSTSSQLLEDGISVKSTSGTGDDFELDDYWEFRAIAGWGPGRMLDLKRNTGAKSNNATVLTIVIDFGSAKAITAAGLYDHNLTNSATVNLEANTSDSWGSPPYQQALTVAELTPILEYLNQTYRYFRFDISDVTNPDGYILIGGIYLGTYTALSISIHGGWGATESFDANMKTQTNDAGVTRESIYTEQRVFSLPYNTLSNTDYATLKGIFQSVRTPSTRQALPLYVHVFSDEDDYFMLSRLQGNLPRTYSSYLFNQSNISFAEVPKTAQTL